MPLFFFSFINLARCLSILLSLQRNSFWLCWPFLWLLISFSFLLLSLLFTSFHCFFFKASLVSQSSTHECLNHSCFRVKALKTTYFSINVILVPFYKFYFAFILSTTYFVIPTVISVCVFEGAQEIISLSSPGFWTEIRWRVGARDHRLFIFNW